MSTDLMPRFSPRLSTYPTATVAPGAGSTYQDVPPSPSSALPGTPTAVARRYGSYTEAALACRSIATGAAGFGVVGVGVEFVCPPPLEGGCVWAGGEVCAGGVVARGAAGVAGVAGFGAVVGVLLLGTWTF